MEKLNSEEFKELFYAPEGSINMIYGKIGMGKTTEGVRTIVKALMQGRRVVSNIPLRVEPLKKFLDERKMGAKLFFGLLLIKKYYFSFDVNNFDYIDESNFKTTGDLVNYLSELKDVLIVWDEGWYLLDSYEGTNFAKSKRQMILHTRHHSREIVVIAQRPSSIQVTARGMVNRFFKCERLFSMFNYICFRVTEYQDMEATSSMPDEELPTHKKYYFVNKNIFELFDTHYLRGGADFIFPEFEVFKLTFKEKIKSFLTFK